MALEPSRRDVVAGRRATDEEWRDPCALYPFNQLEDRVHDATAAPPGGSTLTYTAAFRFEEDWWWAQMVEVPEAFGQGRTLDEARESATEALRAALAWRAEEGEALPPSGQVTVGPITIALP